MKLYKIPDAPAGERFHSSKTGLKDFTEIELPKDGRQGMAAFLNGNELELVGVGLLPPKQLDELEQAELRAVAAAEEGTTMSPLFHYDYNSPFSARTALADIDAAMCVRAVKQFDGPNLGKVVAAAIERMSQLLGAVPGGDDE